MLSQLSAFRVSGANARPAANCGSTLYDEIVQAPFVAGTAGLAQDLRRSASPHGGVVKFYG